MHCNGKRSFDCAFRSCPAAALPDPQALLEVLLTAALQPVYALHHRASAQMQRTACSTSFVLFCSLPFKKVARQCFYTLHHRVHCNGQKNDSFAEGKVTESVTLLSSREFSITIATGPKKGRLLGSVCTLSTTIPVQQKKYFLCVFRSCPAAALPDPQALLEILLMAALQLVCALHHRVYAKNTFI